MSRRTFLRAAAVAPMLAFGAYREMRYHEICGNYKCYHPMDEDHGSMRSNIDGIDLEIGTCGCPKGLISRDVAWDKATWNDADACRDFRNAKRPGYEVRA